MSRLTYEGLGQEIADDIMESLNLEIKLSDGKPFNETEMNTLIMDRANELTPSYLDNYDVADKAKEYIDWDLVGTYS
jgi:hypothetical protein|tara:strand:+ start:318 stop:548 length:231 start_codon:yes stop_codon:yes gene_type:complete